MAKTYKHNVYMSYGSIYDINGCIIEKPALLISKNDGCVFGYGNKDFLIAKMLKMASVDENMADSLMLLDFTDAYYKGVTNEEICYILRRAVEYTASSFQPALCEHALKNDFKEWLVAEMTRMPIDLSESEYTR